MGACLPAEYPQGPVPTLWNEPPELPSGVGPYDAATTAARLSEATAFPPYTSELEPEDTTHLHRLDTGDGTWLCGGCLRVEWLGMALLWICFLWAGHLQEVFKLPEVPVLSHATGQRAKHLHQLLEETPETPPLRSACQPRSSC